MRFSFKSRLARFSVPVTATAVLVPLVAPGASADVWAWKNPYGCNVIANVGYGDVDLGGCVISDPQSTVTNGGYLYTFAIGTDGALWYSDNYWKKEYFTGWHSLGGQITGDVRAWSDSVGRVGAGGKGLDGQFWCTWNVSAYSDTWVSWRHC